MNGQNVSTTYLNEFVNNKEIIREFKKCVKANVFGDFDGIVCRGVSGFLFGPTLAYLNKKKLVVIRKPNENSHSYRICEGHTDIKRYIIVDDFVSTGETLEKIVDAINEWEQKSYRMELVGCFFWKNFYNRNKQNVYDGIRQAKVRNNKIFVSLKDNKYVIEDDE